MAIWLPDLSNRRGPKYRQIVEALSDAIADGRLEPGTQLPPHREMAYQLGLSPNTTSRAYAEGVNRALLRGEVGRGTFVREPGSDLTGGSVGDLRRADTGPIDLSKNLPAPGLAAAPVARVLHDLGLSDMIQASLDYQTDADPALALKAAQTWLSPSGLTADEDTLVITNGAQHGIFCCLMALLRPGDLLLTETLTYTPVRAMADRLGLKLGGVAMDAVGIRPDAFEAACKSGAPRALYLTPTLQSPTTLTLPEDRRRAIAAIAVKYDVKLIEDDVFGRLKADAPPPLALHAPKNTVFLSSLSKCVAPGLRVGFVRAPDRFVPALRQAVHLSCWMTPPLMADIGARLILDGAADRLTKRQRRIARHRQELAQTALPDLAIQADPDGLHLWLPLPDGWRADAFRAEAARQGVLVTEAAAFAERPSDAPNAIRLCLSHEASESRLKQGLSVIGTLLNSPPVRGGMFL
ncbi:PLP-dependent aminotransferase family protein [Rhodospirillaceae bacterium KN72]|uniref:PLP-dependent aminotransferase family protein n=1 Tax=Pacificispira spongiicola TaxID=2729598 RepID=A0A7Y0DZ36_9PROT|nr:PLP-dependent aminotransferase family protein [Pacificispira spongiicola]NMM44231.1 PLP-dependent aminotransferase family protein [Pacificispira spongiicola]